MAYKLLIVDDDKEISEILQSRLLREGYGVAAAFSGEEALDQLKLVDPDVILLDLNLPGINGFDVLKEIREKHIDKWRPVIIVSAKSELESLPACYKLEADHY